jgi:hypothetical protein
MNNLTFGNDQYQYYETICSGSPAGPGFDGTDAVHTHMTNTRLTDPEVLEFRFPVLLEDFHIREGSGGRGKWKAGDGIRRSIRFLETMDCAILSGHRRVPPFGLEGGEAGRVGKNFVRRKDGTVEKLEGCDQTVLEAGEDQTVFIRHPKAARRHHRGRIAANVAEGCTALPPNGRDKPGHDSKVSDGLAGSRLNTDAGSELGDCSAIDFGLISAASTASLRSSFFFPADFFSGIDPVTVASAPVRALGMRPGGTRPYGFCCAGTDAGARIGAPCG